jgi:Ni/Fe-hydrogenase subunit HybB-like protein
MAGVSDERADVETIESPTALPTGLVMAARVAVLGGLAAFLAGVWSNRAQEAWTALLVNYLYFLGLAQAGVTWAATLELARAKWADPVRRLGEACAPFLPLMFIPAIALFVGREWVLPWIGEAMGDRAGWVNVPAVFARNGIGLVVLTGLSLLYVRRNQRARAEGLDPEQAHRRTVALSVLIPLLYVVVFSVLSFDFVMGLRPFWRSSLIGPYFFCGALYCGMAVIALAAGGLGRADGSTFRLGRQTQLDVGNLLLAFGMLTTYMFFAHVLVIWYGNLPEETSFLIARYHEQPWFTLTWVVIGGALLAPFACLVVREVKASPRLLAGVAGLVLVAMWLERYLLVAPSLMPQGPGGFAISLFTALGFAGAFLMAFDRGLRAHRPSAER